jgi:hypothetical protein
MELLAVLAILSVLLGIGVGAFDQVRLGRALAVAQVKDALRATRLFAIEQSSRARFTFGGEGTRMLASGFVAAGNWHFEGQTDGWPTQPSLEGGAERIPDGAIGGALRLPADSPGFVKLGTSPSFDAPLGLAVEAFVRVEPGTGGVIVRKGNAFALSLTADARLRGAVQVAAASGERTGTAETLVAETSAHVTPGRWTRVGMEYDGFELRLSIDGVEQAAVAEQERRFPVPDPEADLVVGAQNPPFAGDVDEVRFAGVVARESPALPDGVVFAATGTIVFDGSGRLDPAFHARPATLELKYEEGAKSRSVTVGLLGEIQ